MNALYYGDNLAVLRESIKDNSVDLIYLDPPERVKEGIEVHELALRMLAEIKFRRDAPPGEPYVLLGYRTTA